MSEKSNLIISVDTETTGLDPYGTLDERGHYPDRPFAFSFTDYDSHSFYIRFDVDNFSRQVIYDQRTNEIKAIMEDPTVTKVMHNAPFDIIMMKMIGIETKGKVFDTRIMSHVFDSSRMSHALKPLAIEYLGMPDDDQKDLIQSVNRARRKGRKEGWCLSKDNKADYHLGDHDLCKKYAIGDTERTMGLYWCFEDLYNDDADYRQVVDMEHELMWIIIDMQMTGARLDSAKLKELKKYYEDAIHAGEEKKANLGYASLNTRSYKQMKEVFYDQLKMPVVKGKTGNPTVNSATLQRWATNGVELASYIVEINGASHELSTFIDPFIESGYRYNKDNDIALHPNYNQVGPITGRISCNKPNLMNIPSNDSGGRVANIEYRTREAFIPRKDCVWYLPDYSQVEVWIAMYLSKDPFGMQQLEDGQDMHGNMAERIWGKRHDYDVNKKKYRKMAKFILFGLIYGGGVKVIADIAQCSYDDAEDIRNIFHQNFWGLSSYMQELIAKLRDDGYIKNPFGRKYSPPSDTSYKILNYMIQGTASDVMKRAMINVHHLIGDRWKDAKILLTIHDEMIIEVPRRYHSKKLMREIITAMQGDFHHVIGIPKPLGVGMKYTTTNWSEVIEIDL